MKKQLLIFPLLFLLAGCQSPGGGISSENIQDKANTTTTSFEYIRPEGRADISGTIKSIIGNEVTISGKDMSEIFGTNGETDFRKIMSTMTEDDRQKMREEMNNVKTVNTKITVPVGIAMGKRIVTRSAQSTNTGEALSLSGTVPGSGGGGGGGFGGGMRSDRGAGTNEGATPNIPESGGTMQEASLSDLKIGLNIDIWLDQSQGNRKIAENALITEIKTSVN